MTPSEMYLPARLRTGAPHLLKTELRQLRTLLETERATQVAHLSRAGIEPAIGGDDGPDRQLDDALTSHAREVLADAEAALARIEAGTYGVCEECDDPVPYERLEALPTARTCIDCTGRGRGFLA